VTAGTNAFHTLDRHRAEAISADDGGRTAKSIQDALGIESDDVAN
jgi:hypothetical protein